ncbi:MAG: response regulator [Gemmatimonadota bacterium]|jgi:putative nucleotidyltransferase with HDIG domain
MSDVDPVRAPTDRELRELGFTFRVPQIEEVGVFVVDDDRTSLELLEAFVRRVGHPVRSFSDPGEALEAIRSDPPKILVTDMVMPGMTGVELVHEARAVDPDIGVVLVTAYGDEGTAAATAELGVSSSLAKPIELDTLNRALQRAYLKRAADEHHRAMVNWMYEAMARNAADIRDVTLGTLTSLMNALDARSPHFQGHSRAVALQAAAVAEALGLDEDEIEAVRIAGMLHDIGMIGVPDAVVDKPGPLTPDEMELIRSHCDTGAAIIEPMKHIGSSIRYVLEHHERWDGSGYPDGKKGDEISLGGQIVGISEAWIAILETRAYREGRSREEGLEILREHKGEWFTAEVTDALIESDLGLM